MRFPLNIILKKYPKGGILQNFGENPELYSKIGLAYHNGIDCYAPKGTPIYAPEKMKIMKVRTADFGFGRHIKAVSPTLLEHTFGHLEDIFVKEGDMVEEGQVIGTVGNSGFVISGGTTYWGNAPGNKGVHLHYGIREVAKWKPGVFGIFYPTGDKYEMLNYDNGVKGAVNPLPFFTEQVLSDYKKNLELQVTLLQKIVELYKKVIHIKRLLNKK